MRGVGLVSASLRPSHPLAAGALFDRSHIWGVGLMNCDAVHRSHPLAAGALPKFESGICIFPKRINRAMRGVGLASASLRPSLPLAAGAPTNTKAQVDKSTIFVFG